MKRLAIITTTILALAAGSLFLYFRLSPTPLPEREFVDRLLGDNTVKVKPPSQIKIILTGDIMLSRNVAATVEKAGADDLPFQKVTEFLNSADLAFGNLESPFSGSNYSAPSPSLVFNAPPRTVEGLVKNNFRVLSLANNHALDQKLAGLLNTKILLAENGIKTTGAGASLEEAWAAAEIEIKNTRLCFLAASYASVNDGGKSRNDFVARIDDLPNL